MKASNTGTIPMTIEEMLKEGPLEYMDGDNKMRLIILPGVAVCLDVFQAGQWTEVTSMRMAAFNAVLSKHDELR